jgi:hypothetical protein
MGPRSLCGELGLPRNSKLGTQEAVPTLDKWILEKQGDPMYKFGKAKVVIQLHKRKT